MEFKEEDYILLMADCLPVKGTKNSAIYDLSRGDIHTFPSEYFDLFEALKRNSYGELKLLAAENNCTGEMEEFLSFLAKNEMIIAIKESEQALFPSIDLDTWDSPNIIQNAIIDIKKIKFDFKSIFAQLDTLTCEYLQIRQYDQTYSIEDIDEILMLSYDNSLLGIELILHYDSNLDEGRYKQLLISHPILSAIYVHNSPKVKTIYVNANNEKTDILGKKLSFTSTYIESSEHCGVINKNTFTSPSANSIAEFKQFNGCLNRKISVDQNGDIRNCPSMNNQFGNIADISLVDVIEVTEFKKTWHYNKDNIETCNVCEYRYICSDCRAYTSGGEPLSKPEKCMYDPFSGVWREH